MEYFCSFGKLKDLFSARSKRNVRRILRSTIRSFQKRRPCTLNSTRSSGNTGASIHVRELDRFPIKTKSSHDLKRRRLQRCGPKLQRKTTEINELPLRRDAFGSLESLFDLKKPLNLPEVFSLTVECCQEGHVYPFESEKLENSKNLVESLHLRHRADLEPHILERVRFWY